MWKNKRLNILIQISIWSILLFATIGFVSKRQSGKTVKSIKVLVENRNGHFFINEQDIISIMPYEEQPYILGADWSEISLKKIEKSIKSHKFVEQAQVYRDLEGNLIAEVKQCLPIARIINANGSGAYITDLGEIIPLSDRYTARVTTVEGAFFESFQQGSKNMKDTEFFEMLEFIRKDRFWSAQFAHMRVDKKGEITILPQVSKQVIEFGNPEGYRAKLKKLKVFYEKILPRKGWNNYERVNVKYKGQIICE